LSGVTLGGTLGTQQPGLVSVTGHNDGGHVGPEASDTVRIVFDIPTNQSITAGDLATAVLLSNGTWGNSTVVWVDDKTMDIVLGSTANVFATSNYTVTIDYDQLTTNGNPFKNIGLEAASTSTGLSTAMAIAPTFGAGAVPTAITAATTTTYDDTT
ncbi:hypothetical protein AB4114_35920, partial [Paenibacillus sp. 2RAB27]|uniref:hypothetical protein n=1 Tax=Paenibacillus sp. 2RAB27 TaxID=3232991 RepID=UPI003F9870F3